MLVCEFKNHLRVNYIHIYIYAPFSLNGFFFFFFFPHFESDLKRACYSHTRSISSTPTCGNIEVTSLRGTVILLFYGEVKGKLLRSILNNSDQISRSYPFLEGEGNICTETNRNRREKGRKGKEARVSREVLLLKSRRGGGGRIETIANDISLFLL